MAEPSKDGLLDRDRECGQLWLSLCPFSHTLGPALDEAHRIFALYRSTFGLPVGPDAFGSGLFSYFIGGGAIDKLAGPSSEVEERICRAMNLQNIFCNPTDGDVTSERIRVALQLALEHCHNLP